MNITSTGIAVALAVVVALGFMFFGASIFVPFSSSGVPAADVTITQNQNQFMVTDDTVGTGAEAKAGDTVSVTYTGMLQNGTVFDASANHGNQPFTFTLGGGEVIQGWDQGIVGMKVGGTRTLVIPPELGYGSRDLGVIPPDSTLIFKVQLLQIN